jgi:hypothetical protein
VTVSLEDCYFVGASYLQAQRRSCQRALPTVAVLAAVCTGRVERDAGDGIFRVGASITGNQIANRVPSWNHGTVGLACGVGARQIYVPALLDGRVSSGVNFHAGGHALVDTAEVDHQDAVDEHEGVVVSEELELEGVVEGE